MIHLAEGTDTDIVPFIIDGKDVTGLLTFPVVAPATGKTLWDVSSVSVTDASRAVDSAQAAFPIWSRTKPAVRKGILLRVADLLVQRKEELFAYQSQETGAKRPFMEVNLHAAEGILRDVAARLESALQGYLPVAEAEGSHAMMVKEPYGVVLAIAPWNAPIVLGIRSVAFAIATGNTVVLKGSELSPRTFWALGDIFRESGLPAGCINVIYHRPVDASEVTNALIAHPAVKKINFTGSTLVGGIIAGLAGQHIKPVLLELGGKASAIVLADADIALAAESCANGAFIHGGQVCMSTERILVHESIANEFTATFTQITHQRYGSRAAPYTLINAAAVTKNQALVQDAVAKGAKVLHGDPTATSQDDQATHMSAIIVADVKPTMDIFHRESFGLTVSLLTFSTEEEALALANDTDYGLSGAVFSRDLTTALRVARQYETGAVHINSMTIHDEPALVHGGAKKSGYGRFNGVQGLDEFLRYKTITWRD